MLVLTQGPHLNIKSHVMFVGIIMCYVCRQAAVHVAQPVGTYYNYDEWTLGKRQPL